MVGRSKVDELILTSSDGLAVPVVTPITLPDGSVDSGDVTVLDAGVEAIPEKVD
jgi:hypothetical protein